MKTVIYNGYNMISLITMKQVFLVCPCNLIKAARDYRMGMKLACIPPSTCLYRAESAKYALTKPMSLCL